MNAYLYHIVRTDIASTDSRYGKGYDIIVLADTREFADEKISSHILRVAKIIGEENDKEVNMKFELKLIYSTVI